VPDPRRPEHHRDDLDVDANLQGAYLDGAKFHGTQLDGADLQDAEAAEDTRWPAGWDRATAEARGVRYRD
jgi:uncharacterized protein YjbI with pentapeptide repeats